MNKQLYSWIPNAITLCNVMTGFLALTFALNGDFKTTFLLVILAAIFDFCDGLAARTLNAYSNIGKDLDSLADMISFGAVPTAIMYTLLSGSDIPELKYLALLIVALSALRLAIFNNDESQSSEFRGLPTPASALFFVSYAISASHLPVYAHVIAVVAISTLLVANVRMFSFKFKSLGFKDNSVRYIFLLGAIALSLCLALALDGGGYIIPACVILLYIFTSILYSFCPKSKR